MKISRLARVADLVRDLFTSTADVAYALLRLPDGHTLVKELPDYHGSVSLSAYAHEAVMGLEARGLLDNFVEVLQAFKFTHKKNAPTE